MQVPRGAEYRPLGVLDLHSWFPTIQGEGPFCGERALFFRLWGCNLRCPGCDTEYTAKRQEVTSTFMVNLAREIGWEPGALVVITGGEPMRQAVGPSVTELVRAGYRVQIETNGILLPEGLPWGDPLFSVVCAPKTSKIHEVILHNAAAFKYVVRAGEIDPDDGLPTRALKHKAEPRVARPPLGALVYVQPMDEGDPVANALNLDAAIRSTMEHGHRLQIQVHKHINME
jgi:organic radical activating enzyme